MKASLKIADHSIGKGQRAFIIAEAGVNHNGDLSIAYQMIEAAKHAGADAVKFQSFRADRLVSDTLSPSHYEILKGLELGAEAHLKLYDYCRRNEILFLSTPFDELSADLLELLPVAAFKIASGELTHLSFLEHVARKKRPILLSTGMSSLGEVKEAVATIKKAGGTELAILHCTSTYPAKFEDVNLRAIETLRKTFRVPVGFSDHTPGIAASIGAVALGATILEKHFTLDRGLPGPDHAMSINPKELAELVTGVRNVEAALGTATKQPVAQELFTAALARRSLVTLKTIPEGTPITQDLVGIKRPGTGLPPRMLKSILGRKTRREIPAGALIANEMLW